MPRSAQTVRIPAGDALLDGELCPANATFGTVIFAHGSGSSRLSPRNRHVALQLWERGLGTLLFDLLTPAEEAADARTRALRFDIPLLAERLLAATRWLQQTHPACGPCGYFGASTGAAAALIAAAAVPDRIGAVVSRGGRPDLAGAALGRVRAPTLLIVGRNDSLVLDLNEAALQQLRCPKELVVIPSATHLFEEPGTLDQVADCAAAWFTTHLQRHPGPADQGRSD